MEYAIYDFAYLVFVVVLYYLIIRYLYLKNYIGIKISLNIIFVIHSFSFLFTIIANPGIPPRKYYYNNYIKNIEKEEESNYDRCKICNIITPKKLNVSHCYFCDVCVINHDHHCTFFGKCIGKNNCILFYTTIVTVPLYLIICFISLVGHLIYIDEEETQIRKMGRRKF